MTQLSSACSDEFSAFLSSSQILHAWTPEPPNVAALAFNATHTDKANPRMMIRM